MGGMKNVCFMSSSLSHASYSLVSTRARSDRLRPRLCGVRVFVAKRVAFFCFSFPFFFFVLVLFVRLCLFSLFKRILFVRALKWIATWGKTKGPCVFFKLWNPIAEEKKVPVMRSNLWNSSSWKFRFYYFPSPLVFRLEDMITSTSFYGMSILWLYLPSLMLWLLYFIFVTFTALKCCCFISFVHACSQKLI